MLVKIYGVVDLIAAGIIFFSDINDILKIILVVILVFKGIPSLFG